MRTQDENPGYLQFGHLLPPSGRYPARDVDICWNLSERFQITDVEVVYFPRDHLPPRSQARRIWAQCGAHVKRWQSDLGNCCDDWLESDGTTPETVFGHLLDCGFASKSELRRALEEFAHIEECDWARGMLREVWAS